MKADYGAKLSYRQTFFIAARCEIGQLSVDSGFRSATRGEVNRGSAVCEQFPFFFNSEKDF